MNGNTFVDTLVDSYPTGIRADSANVAELKRWIKRKNYSSEDMDAALDMCRETFRMSPSIADLTSIFIQVRSRRVVSSGEAKAREYFTINGYSYCRNLDIDSSGNIISKDVPEDAEGYELVVPDHLRANDKAISFEEAYNQGAISEELYKSLKKPAYQAEQRTPNRWQKIASEIKAEEYKRDYIDDSMAANPETPLGLLQEPEEPICLSREPESPLKDILKDRSFWLEDI
jgi:hypothetical protein